MYARSKYVQIKLPFLRALTLPVLWLAGLLLPVFMLIAASIGPVAISMTEAMHIVLHALGISQVEVDMQQEQVLLSLRFPRVLLAACVGAALGVSGAAIQGLFRNPLAEPGLIGILAGASLAVALLVVFGAGLTAILPEYMRLYTTAIAAFGGGLLACSLVFRFASLTGSNSVAYMLLAGIAINAIAFAGTNFLIYSSNDQQMRTLNFWLMGSVGGALWSSVIMCATILLPCFILLMRQARALNIILLGEQEARHLGVDPRRLKRTIILAASLCTGAAVAVSGPIGFIGLVVPHLVRLLIGTDHRLLLPASALGGAMLLVLSDTIARTVVAPAELPVGILTALIGGPYFLWLLVSQYSRRFGQ